VAESYVVFIGALLPDEKSAAVISPLLLALMMASGGFFVSPGATPLFFQVRHPRYSRPLLVLIKKERRSWFLLALMMASSGFFFSPGATPLFFQVRHPRYSYPFHSWLAILPFTNKETKEHPLLFAPLMASGGFFLSPGATPLFFQVKHQHPRYSCPSRFGLLPFGNKENEGTSNPFRAADGLGRLLPGRDATRVNPNLQVRHLRYSRPFHSWLAILPFTNNEKKRRNVRSFSRQESG